MTAKLLLDTHFVIWLATDNEKIRIAERDLLIRLGNEIHMSVISLWEIRIKWQALDRTGRPKGALDPQAALLFATHNNFKIASLNSRDVITPLDPPVAHRDPFDEMLLAHAQGLGARLLTRDRELIAHPLALQL